MTELDGQKYYDFADYRLIPGEGLLLHDGKPVTISPKVFETLLYLVERRGHLVHKAELMDRVWADAFVEENAVSKSVWSIRNILGEDSKDPRFIQTVPKRGYRFVGTVNEVVGEPDRPLPERLQSPVVGNRPVTGPDNHVWSRPRTFAIAGIVLAALFLSIFAVRGRFTTAETVEIRSISVIPFTNASGDPEEEYLVNGVTETLIADLSRINALRLIALPEDLRRQAAEGDFTEIGRRDNVDGLLSGSVSRSGDRIKVTVQLTRVPNGTNLWSNTYERDLREIQGLHEEITRNVVREIRVTLSPEDAKRLSGHPAVVPEAFDQFLLGRYYVNRQNPQDQETAISALERAVEIDPTFALAYTQLAQAYTWEHYSFSPEKTAELSEKASIAAAKALELDSNLPEAYLARGRVLWTPGRKFPHARAIKDYRHALQLDPKLDEARNQLALVYCHIGALDEALRESYEGVKQNPDNNLLMLRIGQSLNSLGRYKEALPVLQGIPEEVHPSMTGHQTVWALLNLGRIDEATAKTDELLKAHPDDRGGTFASLKAVLAAMAGQNSLAEKYIKEALEKGKGFGHFHHTEYTIASAYALMNKVDDAIRYLKLAADSGFPCYPAFEIEPSLNNIRQDPRFIAFMSQFKDQWEEIRRDSEL